MDAEQSEILCLIEKKAITPFSMSGRMENMRNLVFPEPCLSPCLNLPDRLDELNPEKPVIVY